MSFKKGYSVRAFCLYNSQGSLGWIDTLPSNIKDEIDIILGDVKSAINKEGMKGCNIVFHLASLIAIPYSYLAFQLYRY